MQNTFAFHNCSLTFASAKAEKGVSSAGLSTTVQPAAIAAQAFLVIIALGLFHCKILKTFLPKTLNHVIVCDVVCSY